MHVGSTHYFVSFGLSEVREKRHGFSRAPTWPDSCDFVLWNRNDLVRLRFRHWKSFDYVSGSVQFRIQIRNRIQTIFSKVLKEKEFVQKSCFFNVMHHCFVSQRIVISFLIF
jgi:hypothetical protein